MIMKRWIIMKRIFIAGLTFSLITTISALAFREKQQAISAETIPLPILKGEEKDLPASKADLGLVDDLAPLNELTFANFNEQRAFIKTLDALYKNRPKDAAPHQKKLTSPAAQKLVHWYALRSNDLNHPMQELAAFLKDNPGWPSRNRLAAKIERIYLQEIEPGEEAITYFKDNPPVTSLGRIAYAEALIKTGKQKQALELIRETYQKPNLSIWMEKRILANHKTHLRPIDHRIRMDRLLYTGYRSRVSAAMRAAKYLGAVDQEAAKFRAAVNQRRIGAARKMYRKLSSEAKKQPGVHYAYIRLAKRLKQKDFALKLMKQADFKKEDVHGPDKWWLIRRSMARDAINENDYKTAYELTSRHEHPSVNLYKDAEFLSGWVALRFLKKPAVAETHFRNFRKAADGPLSRSKSGYWLGRALKAQNKQSEAEKSFEDSAALFNTYYGQLSANELDRKNAKITIPEPLRINPQTAKNFMERDEIKAIILSHRAEKQSVARLFFAHLRYHLTDPVELTLLAELAATLGYNQSTVRIGKTAMAQKNILPMANYAYPVRFMPQYEPLRSVPEKAIVYSIARQESEFNYEIKSHAGARGLLQVMPNTLKHIARKYKIKWHTSWLTNNPSYNARVASAYIGDRHDEFGGSYIMTFAGFNAGPGRVRQWVRKFGDPRDENIDPIDWVERIPFTETRKYVQKVMANLQVYRARLSDGTVQIQSHKDLHRGKF